MEPYSRMVSRLLMSSWGMKGLAFTLGSMSNFGVSFIRSESWKVEGGWRDGLGIWFVYFQTLLSLQGGTRIGTGKGGGQGTKGLLGSSYEIRRAWWFTKFGELETLEGLDSSCKEMWT